MLGVLLWVAGCGLGDEEQGCTLIGCSDGGNPFLIVGPDGGALAPGVYALVLTLDGVETSMVCDATETDTSCEKDGHPRVFGRVTGDRQISISLEEYGPTAYTVVVERPEGEPVTREGEIIYEDSFPNGPDCGAGCKRAEEPTVITLEP